MSTAAAHVEGALPSSNKGHSTEVLKAWWDANQNNIRGRYERAKPIIKAYCTLVITNCTVIFAGKRARGCSPGASRTEGADSPAGITYLHEICMCQHGVVQEMGLLARVYERFCGGAEFSANNFSDVLRLYLMRETQCEVRNAFGAVVKRSGMCTRGPASQL